MGQNRGALPAPQYCGWHSGARFDREHGPVLCGAPPGYQHHILRMDNHGGADVDLADRDQADATGAQGTSEPDGVRVGAAALRLRVDIGQERTAVLPGRRHGLSVHPVLQLDRPVPGLRGHAMASIL